jgi:hypothetical protein
MDAAGGGRRVSNDGEVVNDQYADRGSKRGVAGLVGIEGGVVSGVINLESSGV